MGHLTYKNTVPKGLNVSSWLGWVSPNMMMINLIGIRNRWGKNNLHRHSTLLFDILTVLHYNINPMAVLHLKHRHCVGSTLYNIDKVTFRHVVVWYLYIRHTRIRAANIVPFFKPKPLYVLNLFRWPVDR
jgi:hypothetical protein